MRGIVARSITSFHILLPLMEDGRSKCFFFFNSENQKKKTQLPLGPLPKKRKKNKSRHSQKHKMNKKQITLFVSFKIQHTFLGSTQFAFFLYFVFFQFPLFVFASPAPCPPGKIDNKKKKQIYYLLTGL